MSDIYNEHLNSQLQSHADILELATALSADGIYYSEREQLLEELESRRFLIKILVDRVSNTYSTVPDNSLRNGRTIQGAIVDTEIEVKIQLPDALNDQADSLSRGDSYEVEGIVNRWVSGLDQFELWGVMPSNTESTAAAVDSTEPDPEQVESVDSPEEQPTTDDSGQGPEEDSSEDRKETSIADPEEDTAGEPAEKALDNPTTDDQTPESSELDVQDSVAQEEQKEQAEVEISTKEDDTSDDEADVEPVTAELSEETSEDTSEGTQEESQEETTTEPSDEQVAKELADLFETVAKTEDLYTDEQVGESDDVQNTVLEIVAGLGFAEQFSEAEKETNGVASDPFSVSKSKPKDKPTATTRSRSKSQSSAYRLVKGCLIAQFVIFGVVAIVVVGAEMLKDTFRTSTPYAYDIAEESPSSIQTKANEADHITWLITSKQINALEGTKRLLPKTADNDKAGKTIVQQFAISPIGISRSIHDELMNAPMEYVVPLKSKLEKALTHPWSTPQHKPLLRDVINRIETEGADPDADTDADAKDADLAPFREQAKQFIGFIMQRVDTNSDGVIDSDEIAASDNPARMKEADTNKDGEITKDEMIESMAKDLKERQDRENSVSPMPSKNGDGEKPAKADDAKGDADADTDETEGPKIDQKQMARARQLADFLLDKLDADTDGELSSDEINQADNPKNTRSSDLNKDGKITYRELVIDIYNKIGSQATIDPVENN